MLAGRRYGIPVFGTHAHSWVMSFDSELEAFRAFAKSSPKNCTLLIDTYDVREGCEHAITVAKEMEAAGERLSAIRIDSGDLAKLSKYVRGRFDAEGLPYVGISVSNDLDEYTIQSLIDQGAPINSFGVGTKLATCYDQPALGGVYKLSARRASEADPWTPVVKLSEQPYKRTIPGVQRVRRYYDGFGGPVCDMIYDEDHLAGEGAARGNTLVAVNDAALVTDVSELEYRELLVPIVRDGSAVAPRESIEDARERCAWALKQLCLKSGSSLIWTPLTSVSCTRRPMWWAWSRAWRRCATSWCARTWPRPRLSPGLTNSLDGRGKSRFLGRQLGRSLNS